MLISKITLLITFQHNYYASVFLNHCFSHLNEQFLEFDSSEILVVCINYD